MFTKYFRGFERNILLLMIMNSIHKRVYLPLIVIYALSVDVSLEQIGIISGITALATLLLEVPSGYLSDKMGHKYALILASVGVALSPLCFVLFPGIVGVVLGSLVYFGLGAFRTGTAEAFLHETLEVLKRGGEYSRVSSQITRRSLVANIVLVSLIPLTYGIDPRMPFIIASLLGVFLVGVLFFLIAPRGYQERSVDFERRDLWRLIVVAWKRGEFLLFLLLGLLGASFHHTGEFREVYFQSVGVPVEFLGFVLAMASVAGIVFTYVVVFFSRLSERVFYCIEMMIVLALGMSFGFILSSYFGVIVFILYAGYARIRRIVVSEHLLRRCSDKNLKATYISLYSFMTGIFGMIIPVVLGFCVGQFGIHVGYAYYAFGATAVLVIVYALNVRSMHSSAKAI